MDPRRHSPAAERNAAPILAQLRRILPDQGLVLEVAAGTGQHAVGFAAALPQLQWQPTDPSLTSIASINAWRSEAGCANLLAPLSLDTRGTWPVSSASAIVCINMVHIAPWNATTALFSGAARVLEPGGPLVIYGPFQVDGQHTSAGNVAFDRSLRQQDPNWGIRDVRDLDAVAAQVGLESQARVEMPANNRLLVYRQRSETR